MSSVKLPVGTQRFTRYVSDPKNAPPNAVSVPCQNMLLTEDGRVEQRKGYLAEFSIGVDGQAATAFYSETYDVAFFALGTKVYYHDFQTAASYDTGLTLTAGTTTRFEEWFGIIFLTNTTDGMRMIQMGRINDAAATAGDTTVSVDLDLGGRLTAFNGVNPIASASLVIEGTAHGIASLVVATGVVTLDGTLSATYSDNRFCLVASDISSGREKFSKTVVWKSRLHGMGFPAATNADHPNNTVMAGQFVIGQTGATGIELIIDFTFGTGGSTKITVGSGGAVKNIIGVADSFYFLNERKTHSVASTSIDSSGASIGLTIPDEKDGLHGCLNEDCAALAGNEALIYATPDKRIMRQRIDPDTGTPLDRPEEDFDVDIRQHLLNLDKDQTGALVYHYRGGRQTICQLKETGQWKWFIWDDNIVSVDVYGNVRRGAWQPPQQITPVRSFFERNGVLYGTDPSDDTVYSFFTTFTDNQVPIYAIFATGILNVGSAMLKTAHLQGTVNQPSQINLRCFVWNNASGRRSGSPKIIDGSDYSYSEDNSVGAVPVGDGGVGETTEVAEWSKEFDIFPSEATRCQLTAISEQDGGYFSISSYQLSGQQYAGSFSSRL